MKIEDLVTRLVNLGIIHKLGEEYFLTSAVDDMTKDIPGNPRLSGGGDIIVGDMTTKDKEASLYPPEIRNVSPNKKIDAFYNYCKIPMMIQNQNVKYMPRSKDVGTMKFLVNLMGNPKIVPSILIACITDYYSVMETPKGMKSFIDTGDLISLYNYYSEGNKLTPGEKPSNQVWQ